MSSFNGPDEQMAALFAPALKEYRETEDSIPQIAARHGMKAYILDYYLRKWHPEDVMRRRMSREERLSAKKRELALRPDRSVAAVARRRYAPAIPLLQEGMTLTQAAKLLGVEMWNLSMWLHRNHPEILEETRAGLKNASALIRPFSAHCRVYFAASLQVYQRPF